MVAETKESKLIKLLSGKKSYSHDEIVKHSGYAIASVNMYLSQGYLDRKSKPYRVIETWAGKKRMYRYEPRKIDNNWHKPGKGKTK